MAKRQRPHRKLRPELVLDARELENIVFECAGCRCRIEVTPDGGIREDAACPCCGKDLAVEHQAFGLYKAAYDALFQAPAVVRFRIAPRGRFKAAAE